jgi:UDP:flavonoid glycosyltransferase YjiC (YdhE family)
MGAVPADAEAFYARVPALVRSTPITPLSAELERFIDGRSPGEQVVYLGFGSMPSADRERLFDCASELGRVAQARVVLASTYGASGFGRRDARVLCIGDADHRALFPRVDFVVHHGGAGTTASALRAGKPQLLVPHVHDQFAHGRRIAELGLGPSPIPRGKLDALGLVRAVAEREKYRERARELALELAGDNGAAAAADLLERLLDGAARPK